MSDLHNVEQKFGNLMQVHGFYPEVIIVSVPAPERVEVENAEVQ